MKNLIIILTMSIVSTGLYSSDIYKTSKQIDLRAPSVPIITSDTYLSIWSPYDQLTEGNTEHWTGTQHPIIGALRVDGKVYRFMGKDKHNLPPLASMTHRAAWEAQYTFKEPNTGWKSIDFDDSGWKTGEAAFGTKDMPRMKTLWETKNIWVRRTFNIDMDVDKEDVVLIYSHDDVFELYLNGEKLVETDYSWNNDVVVELNANAKKKLRKGKNVIAVHCQNKGGGAYVDFGLFLKPKNPLDFGVNAKQISVDVLPTQTYYTFECGPVELDLVFTAPLLMDNLDLISTPINYISYRVRPLDKKEHDVQIYFETTPELAVNETSQPVVSEKINNGDMVYLKTGTIDQPYTKRIGDGVRIDWGYAYLASDMAKNKDMALGEYFRMKEQFIKSGSLLPSASPESLPTDMRESMTVLAYTEDLGKINKNGSTGFLMLGYDDIYSIEYFYKRRMAYWKHNGTVDIFQAFEKARNQYQSLMKECRAFDIKLMEDALISGGKEYAEICALTYRQAIVAHKLITNDEGELLFLSKENHSNGCINTVDITYPSSPLFLIYNIELLKGMLTPIFYYSESGRWKKPFPAHDLGTYPIANGQLYGGDMPVEEAGNMIILTAAVSTIEGNTNYADKHWQTLTTWVNYLVEHGLDPENQLCTDDFAGHLAHNANLSVKAIMAIAGYGHMAKMKGETSTGEKYIEMAKSMAKEWERMANDGDHYRLTFDRPGTWSQKYNLIWDRIFDWNIFPGIVIEKEIPYYLSRQKEHKYGLPLDSRKDYTKSDWIMWTACMKQDKDIFERFITPIYKYANETTSRVPISDWHDTQNGKMMNFKARSVVGGYFMRMLDHKLNN